MRTRCFIYVTCLVALGAVLMGQANACPICPVQDGDEIRVYDPGNGERFGGGGNFLAENVSQTVNDFLTFCLERSEYLSLGDLSTRTGPKYTVQIDTGAIRGGVSGQDPSGSDFDPLDSRTAYLYSNFIADTLPDLIGGVSWNGADMQNVVWVIEGEWTGGLTTGGQALMDLATANAVDGQLYNVRVMNLLDSAGNHKQSLLVSCVPEPSTMAVWGLLGVCGLLITRRRRK